MAAESSSASAGRSSSGGATADSYIGSLISLTSKSEIRYEGILYNINTDESSIGLQNVRSFGTEGRKKDGVQVPPSDKIYEYILFRGSDIKDLQVKSTPPVQTAQAAPPINSDPAIIQSHYSPLPPSSMPVTSAFSGLLSDLGSHTAQLGPLDSTFQGGLPLYQPGGNLNTWGPTPPPNANGSGLAMPMYWQGFYGTPNGLPQLPQQPLLQPSPGLSLPPHAMQQYTHSSSSLTSGAPSVQGSNRTESTSLLAPIASTSLGTSSSLFTYMYPTTVPPIQHATVASTASSLLGTPERSTAALSTLAPLAPVSSGDLNPAVLSLPRRSNIVPDSLLQHLAKPVTAMTVTASPPLITPRQLLQPGPASVSPNQSSQTAQRDVEVVQVSKTSSEPPAPASSDKQAPILMSPPSGRSQKLSNGAPFQARFNYRGRGGRGRGNGVSRPVTRFAEDFDFEAMNEKFNKNEVWGHLGKSNKQSDDKERNGYGCNEDYSQDQYDEELPKADIKPIYKKDDFFDCLSSSTGDNEPNHGRIRFSEQRKIDTETFGDMSGYRGGRGGRGPYRGGRSRGSSYRRGYVYNYAGQDRGSGRGQDMGRGRGQDRGRGRGQDMGRGRGRGQGFSSRGYVHQP